MTSILLGIILLLSVCPFHVGANYFHSSSVSAVGQTKRERHDHISRTLLATAQVLIAVGLGLIAWGMADYIPDSYIESRKLDAKEMTDLNPYGVFPGGK